MKNFCKTCGKETWVNTEPCPQPIYCNGCADAISLSIGNQKTIQDKPDEVFDIYDNGGELYAPRYSVCTPYGVLELSEDPDSPTGVSLMDEGGIAGSHLGKEIEWNELPENIRNHICKRLED